MCMHVQTHAYHASLVTLIPIPPSTWGISLQGGLSPVSAQWRPLNFPDSVEKPIEGPPPFPLTTACLVSAESICNSPLPTCEESYIQIGTLEDR